MREETEITNLSMENLDEDLCDILFEGADLLDNCFAEREVSGEYRITTLMAAWAYEIALVTGAEKDIDWILENAVVHVRNYIPYYRDKRNADQVRVLKDLMKSGEI